LDLIVKLLNRNPKQRLGSGAEDADEIKTHSFFKNINWEDVKERKLKPAKPVLRTIVNTGISFDSFQDNEADTNETEEKIERWTFISNDFK
jgi:protein-serine/threonine kinase